MRARMIAMRSKANAFAVLVLVAVLAFGWWAIQGGIRYKMTVEVETPEGVRSGYAVRELSFGGSSWFPFGESRPYVEMNGEAVAIDLPHGKVLFALLTSGSGNFDYGKQIAQRAELSAESGPIELWPHAPDVVGLSYTDPLPMLVTFEDINDPKSVQRVDPADLAATFGPGYTLRRIIIERTHEAPTAEMKGRLVWLGEGSLERLDPDFRGSTNPNLSQQLMHGAFRHE